MAKITSCEGMTLKGIDEGLLEDLSDKQKRQLVTVISRISERSFRRGYQHGVECSHWAKDLTAKNLRFGFSIDGSPFHYGKGEGHSAIDRLYIEEDLRLIGLPPHDYDPCRLEMQKKIKNSWAWGK